MPGEVAAPGVQDRQEATIHFPVVLLEELEGLRRGRKEQVGGHPVIVPEKLPELFGHSKDDVEMWAVRQPLADLVRPLGLTGTQTVRAMAVAAGAGIPLAMTAILAAHTIEAQRPPAALGHQIEGGILAFAESSGPEVAPME